MARLTRSNARPRTPPLAESRPVLYRTPEGGLEIMVWTSHPVSGASIGYKLELTPKEVDGLVSWMSDPDQAEMAAAIRDGE